MAQVIKLKRSATSGKVPLSSSLELGEIAVNTADGKAFLKRNDETVQSFLITNSTTTGSINLIGNETLTGSLNISGSQFLTGSVNVNGNIYANGVDVIDNAVALAIALG